MTWLRSTIYRLLRWSERYARTDMIYLTKGFSALLGAQLLNTLITFGIAVLAANYVTANDYGTYKYFVAAAGIIGVFTLSGIPSSLSRAAALGYDETTRTAFSLSRLWGTLPMLIAFLGSAYYYIQDNWVLSAGFLIIAASVQYAQASTLWNAFLEGKREFKLKATLSSARNLIAGLCLALTIIFFPHPLTLAIAFFGSHLILNLVVTTWFHKNVSRGGVYPEFSSVARHFTFQNIFKVVATQLDKILIFQTLGSGPLAVYAFATVIPQHIRDAFQQIGTLAFPKFATQKDPTLLYVSILHKTGLLFLVMFTAALAYIAVAPFLFAFFFPLYSSSVPLTQLSALGIAASAALIPAQVLKARAHIRELYIESFATSTFEIALYFSVGLLWGLVGYVVAVVVSKYVKLAVTLYLVRNALKREASLRH